MWPGSLKTMGQVSNICTGEEWGTLSRRYLTRGAKLAFTDKLYPHSTSSGTSSGLGVSTAAKSRKYIKPRAAKPSAQGRGTDLGNLRTNQEIKEAFTRAQGTWNHKTPWPNSRLCRMKGRTGGEGETVKATRQQVRTRSRKTQLPARRVEA